ncbi:MAG: single-stranded DNA-binding protein [Sutterellaceae bacterium]|nr:single-stranded DNA-binding protein [Sutterellaceae bacterium]MDY2869186.1 single-stranded DNA-binding protein [Mesosutterella sp.]
MASVNKVILLGRLGKDPDVRTSKSGDPIVTLSIATSRRTKTASGDRQEETTWHRVVIFGRQAEVARDYLKSGAEAYVEGRLHTFKYTDKSGQERYGYEIIGESLQLGARPKEQGSSAPTAPRAAAPAPSAAPQAAEPEDDIPF